MLRREKFDIPNLDYFQSKNNFTGSLKKFRYKIEPQNDFLIGTVWLGDYCFEKSKILAEQQFPLNNDGLEELFSWLSDQYQQLTEEM